MDFLTKFFRSFHDTEPGFMFMWVLLVVLVFGIAIIVDRAIYLWRKSSGNAHKFTDEIIKDIEADAIERAVQRCQKRSSNALAQVLLAGLQNAAKGSEAIRNGVDEQTLKTIPQLEQRTGYLATIGNVATLIGLMGTIYGLILSFAAVGKPGIDAAEKSTLLASGIAAAMNTTFSGLFVAIPAIVVYALFRSKTQKIIDQIDECSLRVVNALVLRSFQTQKYHIAAAEIKEGVGIHVRGANIKVFADNALIRELNV